MGRVRALEVNKEMTCDNIRDVIYQVIGSFSCDPEGNERNGIEILAKHLGYTASTIYKWMDGTTLPNIIDLDYICKIAGVEVQSVIMHNYEAEYHTLTEQREYFRNMPAKDIQDIENYEFPNDEERQEQDIIIELKNQEMRKLNATITTLQEFVMFLQIIDDKTFGQIRARLRYQGLDDDLGYIQHILSYYVNKLPESEEKQSRLEEINMCTHNPYIFRVRDNSKPFKKDRYKAYFKKCVKPDLDSLIETLQSMN